MGLLSNDDKKASEWFRKAANQGDKDAQKELNNLEKKERELKARKDQEERERKEREHKEWLKTEEGQKWQAEEAERKDNLKKILEEGELQYQDFENKRQVAAEEEKRRRQKLGLCPYCGEEMKGLLKKKCKKCNF